ncbi:hypothetical protein ABZ357_14540 [Streptomyces sp. NPDC005917]|uniref:hypothetical protein n=1 Tax=unclassified Streptomyces TaxID=2593676 RepID=UPI0033C8BAE3
MGGSAKPRRPKAAPAALRVRGAVKKKEKKDLDGLFGCLMFLGIGGGIVLVALGTMLWGDDTWRWAARNWPGGAYAFAMCLGVAAPLLVALFFRALDGVDRKAWKAHPARALGWTVLAVLAVAALLPFLSLAFNAMDSGKRKHGSVASSWVFAHYPWLWAVGIASTLASAVLVVWAAVLLVRRSDAAAGTG